MSIASGVMATKLLPPLADTSFVERPRLLDLLSQNQHGRIILLTAPAGYGKTVLMLQITRNSKTPVVWCQLDWYDNDPAVFLQYLVEGLRRHLPDFGKEVLEITSRGGVAANLRLLVTSLVNELADRAGAGLVLALDDYHVIREETVHRLLQEFLHHLPPALHVLIASRTALPFSLAHRALTGQVVAIRTDELRFTRREIGLFLAGRHLTVSDEIVEALESRTAGWPAALRLAGICVPDANTALLRAGAQEIYDYLAAEVLEQQPENVRSFLLATSVLTTMTPESCNFVLQRTDSRLRLESLDKQQLFLIRLGGATGQERAYRYHDLFRAFLLDRLGAERSVLMRRAGLYAWQLGDFEGAMEYLVGAGAHEEAAEAVREGGKEALRRGRWQTVARWLESLSREQVAGTPWLALYQAEVELYRGRPNEAEAWVAKGEAFFAAREDPVGLAESRLLRARILRARGCYQESLELLERAEPHLPPESKGRRFDLPLEKSLILFLTGRFHEAEALLAGELDKAEREAASEKVVEKAGGGDGYTIAHLSEALANVYYVQGNYAKALRLYRQAEEVSPERVLPGYYAQDNIATIYQDWGEIDRAFEYAKRNVEIKENLGLTETLPSAYLQLAMILADKGQFKLAEEYHDRAISLAREHGAARFYLVLNLAFLARCLGMQGRWVEARANAEEALAEARTTQSGLALALCQEVGAPVFVQMGSVREGVEMLREGTLALDRMGFIKAASNGYAGLASIALTVGDLKAARECAERCLVLAARMNNVHPFLTSFDMLQPVVRLGLESGIEPTFIQRLLVRIGARSLDLLVGLTVHPDPEVRRRAVLPLAEIGGAQAKKAMRPLLDDQDEEVRQLSWAAAQRLGISAAVNTVAKDASLPVKTFLHFECLGPLRVFAGGVEINEARWRTTQTRDLLAYLLHSGGPVSKERILEDLWPESDPRKVSALFHTTLYYLRQTLAELCYRRDLILYRNGRYQLRPGCYDADYRSFEALVSAATSGDNTPEATAAWLEEAVALYRGDYLEDMDYDWILAAREGWKRAHMEARERLGKLYLQAKKHARAITHLRVLTEVNPFAEEAHRLLMTVYAAAGDRLALRKQYRTLVTILNEELGLSPSRESRELYQRLSGSRPSRQQLSAQQRKRSG